MKPRLPFMIFTPLEGIAFQYEGSAEKNCWLGRIPKFLLTGFIMFALICNTNLGAFAQESESTPVEPEAEATEANPEIVSTATESLSTAEEETEPATAEGIPSTVEGAEGVEGEESEESKDEAAISGEKAKSDKVTLIFKDADIRTVLHTLSYKSGVNIVAAEGVAGKVSIRLVDVPWQTAFEVILKNQGLAYEQVGNIIRVITLAAVSEEELQNEVFILNYSKAKDVADAIKDTLTERGKIKYDVRTNTLIVTDIPTNLYKVKEVIARLDRRTPQVAIEAKLIETTLDKDDNLGVKWGTKVTISGSRRPTTLPFERQKAPFSTTTEDGEYAERVGNYLPLLADSAPDAPTTAFPYAAASFGTTGNFLLGTLDFSQFSAVLELLKSRTDTKVISNPTITTLNNIEAKVHVGQNYYIPLYARNESTGQMEISGYDVRDIGVVLKVTPHINEAGDIIVDLKPEVSAYLGDQDLGNNVVLPIFSVRTGEAQVMVKDGQTIAMGGLMKETATKYIKKVPILGDIPILGELFKKTEDAVDTTDLLIFVTVRLIKEDQDDKTLMEEMEKKAIYADKDTKF